jgi:acyl-CoA thioester hydrolase
MRNGLILTDAVVTVAFVAPSGRPRRQPADWMAIFGSLVSVGVSADETFGETEDQ